MINVNIPDTSHDKLHAKLTDEQKTIDRFFLERAVELGRKNVESSTGGPFGAVIVKDGQIVGEGCNRVTSSNDPTAHAEIQAIRAACSALSSFQLEGCTIYSSCEPCPMCLGAIYWARPARVVFASDRFEAADAGFDDALIYRELPKDPSLRSLAFHRIEMPSAETLFQTWKHKANKVRY